MASNSTPTSKERYELAENDWRSPEAIVLTRPGGAANYGYAYHEPNENGEPMCGAGGTEDEFIEVSVSNVQQRNKSPCQMCERVIND